MIGNVYQVRWPDGYLDFLSSFRIFAFDVFDTLRIGCLVSYDAHSAMYGLSIFLLALEVGVIVDLLPILFPGRCASTAKKS
jgi:hypothetical protein